MNQDVGLSPDTESTSALILNFPTIRTVKDKCMWYKSHPIYGILLEQPKWTMTVLCTEFRQRQSNTARKAMVWVQRIETHPAESWCWLFKMLKSASGFKTGTPVIKEEQQAGTRWGNWQIDFPSGWQSLQVQTGKQSTLGKSYSNTFETKAFIFTFLKSVVGIQYYIQLYQFQMFNIHK